MLCNTEAFVIDHARTGRDTTAQTLLWSLYCLSLPENVAVREKIVAEVAALKVE